MILNPDVACNTIISTYNLCPRLFVGLHNATTNTYYIRCMTPRELGQIQGFPADYRWQGTEKEKIAQIGNAVPPPLAERIVRSFPRVEFKSVAQTAVGPVEDDESDDEDVLTHV
jgi:site-specific DNA-cytosine methylase